MSRPSNQRETGAAQSRPVLTVVENDLVKVSVRVGGQTFHLIYDAPDLRGNIMATDLNEVWIRKQIKDLLRSRFGRML